MKIVALLGSPRVEGNSAFLAHQFLAIAEELGATTQSFLLNNLNYRGCQGCYACKTGSEICVLKDDLRDVLAAVSAADLVLLATPVYYGDVTGQLKNYIDRTFSFLTPDYRNSSTPSRLAPGKKLVFIQTQGQQDEAFFADIYPRYKAFLQWQGFQDSWLLRASGLSRLDHVQDRPEILAQVRAIATAAVSAAPLPR